MISRVVHTAIPAGSSEDVKVTIDANKATEKMIAMLLVDEGKLGTFETPVRIYPSITPISTGM